MQGQAPNEREWEQWPGRGTGGDKRGRLRALFSPSDAADAVAELIAERGRELEERSAQIRAAVEELEQCLRLQRNEGHPGDWLLLALAHHGLGDAAAARRWLEVYETWRAGADPRPGMAEVRLSWTDGVAAEVFHEEAARLIMGR